MELLQLLEHPEKEFTPIPFWFLNGNLTRAELKRQLTDFSAHGVHGVVLHPRIGLPKHIEYLSKRFFYYIREAVKAAAELDMKVVLYDEGMYPSGSACGFIVNLYPELASVGITWTETTEPDDEVLVKMEQGALAVRKSGGTLRGIHWGEDDGQAMAPRSADILNPKAVQCFIKLTHEAYYQNLKQYFGSTIIGFFTDEPSILGRNVRGMFPWTSGFSEEFEKAGGSFAELTALFKGEENDSTRLYHQMILKREELVYYKSLSDWCAGHGIALMGHPHQSDDIEMEKYFHIPGQDLVLRWLGPESGGVSGMDSTMAKCSADAARLMKRRRNSNECFGACNRDGNPWQMSGGDMKWYLDWLAVRGVNLFIPHAFYYSIAGKRKEERPPDVGPNSIWWPHYQKWADYMSRLSCLMTDTKLCTEVAVLCRNRDLKPELVRSLFEHQIGFQYLPESVWKECKEENSSLYCRGVRYRAVIGDEQQFPSVLHLELENESKAKEILAQLTPDCICRPAAPELRTAHFFRSGTECWFLVNEGEQEIRTELFIRGEQYLGQYDLWNNRSSRFRTSALRDCVGVPLILQPRESRLIFACTEKTYMGLPEEKKLCQLPCPSFVLTGTDELQVKKHYRGTLHISAEILEKENLILTLAAEEMAELTVNGKPAGCGFWAPQSFDLTGLLREGDNEMTLTVTGSLANRYGKHPVWYGLIQEEV